MPMTRKVPTVIEMLMFGGVLGLNRTPMAFLSKYRYG